MNTASVIIAFIAYTFGVVVLGIIMGRGVTEKGEDYFLARRRIPGWLVAFAAACAGESAWVMMGLVGTGYSDGVSCYWLIPGCIIGYAFNILFLGPLLQAKAQSTQSVTLAEVIGVSTGSREGGARKIAALLIVVFLGCYIAAQFTAAGKAFQAFLGLNYVHGVFIGAAIVIAYTVMGGQKAIVWTHLVQASMMVLSLIVVPIVGLIAGGGPAKIFDAIQQADPKLISWFHAAGGWAAIGVVLGWSGIGLGYPGQPHILMQYMSGKSKEDVRSGWIVSTIWAMCVFCGAITSGIVVRGWLGTVADPEHGLPILAERLLPAWGQGLVLAAIMAAICSTADSQMLAVTAALGVDLLGIGKKEVLETWRRRLGARALFVAVGIVSLIVALMKVRVVFTFVLYAWSALGAGLGPILIALVTGRKLSPTRAIISMLAGAGTVILWQSVPVLKGLIYDLVPAFFVGLVVTWVLSSKPKSESAETGK
jgi:sodium/proline symporter